LAYDVVVVGGGPAGCQVAHRLARSGWAVAVLEQKANHEQSICCTGIVSEECLKEFEVDASLVFCHSNGATLLSPSGTPIRLERRSPQAATINRLAFNAFMAKRACDSGAEYAAGTRVVDITIGRDEVRVVANSEDTTVQYEARAVILATGSDGTLSERLGLGRPRSVVGGAQVEVKTNGMADLEVYFGRHIAPHYFAWLVPTSGDKALAGLLARSNPKEHLMVFLDFLKSQDKIRQTTSRLTSAALPLGAISKSYTDRVLVVGTAAGLVKPTTGGGIYYGLLSADIAADVLGQSLANKDTSQRALASYQRRWKQKFGGELRASSLGRTLFERMNDARLDQAFDIMRKPGRLEAILEAEEISFDWHGEAITHLLKERTLAKLINGAKFPLPGVRHAQGRPFTKGDSK
jgi:digeranylgeranylglycerophospholipid reductase